MKTKKTKIIIVSIMLMVTIITIAILCLKFNTLSYAMSFNKPSRIIVYYNSDTNASVFEPKDEQYAKIYSLILDAYEQPIWNAIFNGELNKQVKILSNNTLNVDFNGIRVNFVYDSPQSLKYKNKEYIKNGENYWYQNLIFNINNKNNLQYNTVAIITPDNANLGQYSYSLHYNAYSNFNNTYNYVLNLF